jgi:Na+-translocating ferredoxin:NAD+ oxidoreductase RnfA subunit
VSSIFNWNLFSDIEVNGITEKIEIVDFLVGCIKKVNSNNFEVQLILGTIAFIELNTKKKLNLYLNSPDNFCFLLSVAKDFLVLRGGNGAELFLRFHAPIACVLIMSDILKNDKMVYSLSPNQRSEMLGIALGLIDSNSDIFQTKPLNVNSTEDWEKWQSQYEEQMNILRNISQGSCDKSRLAKLIGSTIK